MYNQWRNVCSILLGEKLITSREKCPLCSPLQMTPLSTIMLDNLKNN